jgi:hypothetical protein
MAEKRDLIDDLVHTVKEHPVESLIAYELLVPKKKKEEIEGAVIGIGFLLIAMLFVLPALFAPAMEPFICDDLRKIAAGNSGDWRHPPTVEEMERALKKIVHIRRALWIVAVVSWIVFLVVLCLANNGVNLERN